ncbi:MAG: RNA 2',3'-cyclic phosphodiesterase [Dissulfurispiraceae bacterium]
MRCFIAIDISDEVRATIDKVIQQVGGASKGIKWVVPWNIHLTLKFLGEIDNVGITLVDDWLSTFGTRYNPFNIRIRGTGIFPSLRHPNVLWVGIDASDDLKRLANDIDDAMVQQGFKKEDRKFSPHLTVGRVKNGKVIDSTVREFLNFQEIFFGSVEVEEFMLMKSILRPSGAEYSRLATFKLGKL